VSGEQQDGAAGRVRTYLDDHRARYPYDATGVIADLPAAYDNGLLPHHELLEADLRAILAERDALAARVAELESERSRWRDPICGTYYPEAEAVTAREARANAGAETEES